MEVSHPNQITESLRELNDVYTNSGGYSHLSTGHVMNCWAIGEEHSPSLHTPSQHTKNDGRSTYIQPTPSIFSYLRDFVLKIRTPSEQQINEKNDGMDVLASLKSDTLILAESICQKEAVTLRPAITIRLLSDYVRSSVSNYQIFRCQ